MARVVRKLLLGGRMAYPVRHFDPNTLYFLTSRTMQSRLLMAPTGKTNELIGGILARAARQSEVDVFAYVFLSNHFHMMVRAPTAIAMSQFMQQVKGNIAVKVGRFVGWRGTFWEQRYSAEPIVDDGAQVERLGYILKHGVKEGLVSAVKDWPGLSCARALLDGAMASVQTWRNWTQRWRNEVSEGIKVNRFAEECPSDMESLTLKPLPCWSELSAEERSRRTAQIIEAIDAAAQPAAQVMGPARIVAQDPHGQPLHTKRSVRPKAHASTTHLWLAAVHRYKDVLLAYREASRQWFAGRFTVEFPLHCFRPPPWRVPIRIV